MRKTIVQNSYSCSMHISNDYLGCIYVCTRSLVSHTENEIKGISIITITYICQPSEVIMEKRVRNDWPKLSKLSPCLNHCLSFN